jgi:hypothetical protein
MPPPLGEGVGVRGHNVVAATRHLQISPDARPLKWTIN